MKTIVLKIDYTDSTKKFWFDSYIKNTIIEYNSEEKTIHQVIAEACEEEGMTLTYKAKPQGNIFRDKKNGESFIVGYMYRGRTVIHDRNMPRPKTAFFDVWATISSVNKFEFEDIDAR